MALTTFSVRMDGGLERRFDALCSDFGMNATTVFNVFVRAVVREKRTPFEIQTSSDFTRQSGMRTFMALRVQAKENGVQGLPLGEINEEIRKSRYEEVTE